MFKYSVYLPQGKKSKRLNEELAVGIRGRIVRLCSLKSFLVLSQSRVRHSKKVLSSSLRESCGSGDIVYVQLIDSVYSIYSAGSSGNSAAAILYSAGNFGNSAAAICYNTVLEILERVELFYNFYRV
ncbi:hypothetical protein KY284_007313 [Solanum tuberosum]|nr:hypothetical protein KY284_007313 [Solanum tuberosum]